MNKIFGFVEGHKGIIVIRKRIPEIDFLRGIAIILMIGFHILGVIAINSNRYNVPILLMINKFINSEFTYNLTVVFLGLFFILGGISNTFSRNKIRRCLILLISAISISLLTYVVNFFNNSIPITYLGVIHIFCICSALYLFLYKWSIEWILLALCFVLLGYGALCYYNVESQWLYLLGLKEYSLLFEGEYFGLFPYCIYYVYGILWGKMIYSTKKSYLPILDCQIFSPINFIGRNSLIYYFAQLLVVILLRIFL